MDFRAVPEWLCPLFWRKQAERGLDLELLARSTAVQWHFAWYPPILPPLYFGGKFPVFI